MDNLSAHHYEGGEILEVWLEEMGIELIYLPTYSPDLNPIEFCFNKVKTLLNGEFQELTDTNTKLAVMEAVERITTEDMASFYELKGHLICLFEFYFETCLQIFLNFVVKSRMNSTSTQSVKVIFSSLRGRSAHLPQLS